MKTNQVKKAIGNSIKQSRKKKKWSQETLAMAADTNIETIRTIENGTANPTVDKLTKISEKLGVKIFKCQK